jgi:endonuclease III-like uncharacterized protein
LVYKQWVDLDKFTDFSTDKLCKELLMIKGMDPETADVMLLYILNVIFLFIINMQCADLQD